MKIKTIYKIWVFFLFTAVVATACLEGDDMNLPPSGSKPFLLVSNNSAGQTSPLSGLRYFSNQALLFSPVSTSDTVVFAVTLQGTDSYDKDIEVNLAIDEDLLDDYYATDSLEYILQPDSTFDLISTTGVIEKGERYVQFKLVYYPDKIDFTKNYMLPIVVESNSANLTVASNHSSLYYHFIGNPIAGAYKWDYTRCLDGACSDDNGFTGHNTIFVPVNGTTVTVQTGYYDLANYVITFDDDGAGNLSNFEVKIDKTSGSQGNWDAITIVSGPTLTVENDNTKFTIKYATPTRSVRDIYYK